MTETNAKRPSIRDLQIDRPQSDATKERRMPQKQSSTRRKRGFSMGWWVLAVVMLISASIISLPIVFSDTTLNITPVVSKAIFDDAVFNTSEAGAEQEEAGGLLTYSRVEWTKSDTQLLEPTGREQVEEKASGVITVYNNHTSKKQRLIKNTRFETKSGNVYRVRNSIMVPGKSGETPGQLDVTVYADEAGDSYNVENADLTLPGLKSLPDMYSTIYAKVKTPITGGFKGERAVVSEEDKATASANLRTKIKEAVMTEIESRIPVDTRYFDSGVTVAFADTQESEVEGKVQVSESANVSVVVFDKKDFATTISQGVAGNPDKGYPVIKDIKALAVNIDDQATDDDQTVKVVVKGNADFVWHFDEASLKQDLAGKQREALKTILKGYPSIKKAEAIIRPFWRSTFPKNHNDFTIKLLDVE